MRTLLDGSIYKLSILLTRVPSPFVFHYSRKVRGIDHKNVQLLLYKTLERSASTFFQHILRKGLFAKNMCVSVQNVKSVTLVRSFSRIGYAKAHNGKRAVSLLGNPNYTSFTHCTN